MAGDASFDVVSDFDEMELRNALDQVRREVGTALRLQGRHRRARADEGPRSTSLTDDEYRAAAVKDLIESKAIKRNLSLKIFDWGKVEEAGGNKVRQKIGLEAGPARGRREADHEARPRRVPQEQGAASRAMPSGSRARARTTCSGSSTKLRELDESVPLQFDNYR